MIGLRLMLFYVPFILLLWLFIPMTMRSIRHDKQLMKYWREKNKNKIIKQ